MRSLPIGYHVRVGLIGDDGQMMSLADVDHLVQMLFGVDRSAWVARVVDQHGSRTIVDKRLQVGQVDSPLLIRLEKRIANAEITGASVRSRLPVDRRSAFQCPVTDTT